MAAHPRFDPVAVSAWELIPFAEELRRRTAASALFAPKGPRECKEAPAPVDNIDRSDGACLPVRKVRRDRGFHS